MPKILSDLRLRWQPGAKGERLLYVGGLPESVAGVRKLKFGAHNVRGKKFGEAEFYFESFLDLPGATAPGPMIDEDQVCKEIENQVRAWFFICEGGLNGAQSPA